MSEKKNKKKVTRRDFIIKGLAVGTGAVALAGIDLGGAKAASPPKKWDMETDVVVVGSGGAGATAALKAADSGTEVIILEKAPLWGGTTALSGGCVYVPNNRYAKEAGVQDSREKAIAYFKGCAQYVRPIDDLEDEIIATHVDTCNEMLDFIERNTQLKFTFTGWWDYHPEWPGAIAKPSRSLWPVEYKGKMMGVALTQGLLDAVKAKGIRYMLKTPARRLVINSKGEVVGVKAESQGKEISIHAKKAVVLASGGFEWNEKLMMHFMRGPILIKNSHPDFNTGDGHLMAMAIGADLRNMNECGGTPIYDIGKKVGIADWFLWRSKPGAIMVNKYGERFCNEAADYDVTNRSFFQWQNWGELGYRNIPAYVVVDSRHFNKYGIGMGLLGIERPPELPPWITKADTLSDLAVAREIDPTGLERTIREFNKNAIEGKDPVFHRGESFLDIGLSGDPTIKGPAATLAPLETPPFYGAKILPGTYGTRGGAKVNIKAQVLTPFNEVIRGLYAAGNVSGAAGVGYGAPGHSISYCMTFGYIAAKNAAKEPSI